MCSAPSLTGNDPFPLAGDSLVPDSLTDDTLDATLRQVPLPEGFVARLDKLVYELSDEPTDHVDFLGC